MKINDEVVFAKDWTNQWNGIDRCTVGIGLGHKDRIKYIAPSGNVLLEDAGFFVPPGSLEVISHTPVGDEQFEKNKELLLATALDEIRTLRRGQPPSDLERVLEQHVGHLQPLTIADLATL